MKTFWVQKMRREIYTQMVEAESEEEIRNGYYHPCEAPEYDFTIDDTNDEIMDIREIEMKQVEINGKKAYAYADVEKNRQN